MARRSGSSVRDERVAGKGRRTLADQAIDFSDIPEASEAQLRGMRPVGRPPLGERARQLIAIRVDPDVLEALRNEAARSRIGYQTLVNRVLADYVRDHVA